VQELGLGRALDPAEATGEAVRAAVEAVHADPGSRARIAAMQAEMRAADGAEGAAEAIRRYATGAPPPAPRTPHLGEATGA
jgi:UDP:flavonoid glycosyltransferase YjiC (YdhE family)